MARSTIDEVGKSTLEHLSVADRLNDWMFDSIRPFVKGKVLEIGSGIGNISSCFIKNSIPLYLSDYSDHYCSMLNNKFGDEPLVNGIYQIDLADTDFDTRYKQIIGQFDTIFALNVIEHINDDHLAIANCRKLLSPGGHLIILVPAWKFLYNGFDKELEHFRRYNRSSVMELFTSQQLDIIKTWYFNLAGILGWFVSGNLLKKKTIPSSQLTFYNKLVPFFKLADKITMNQIGLSVIIVGKKPK